MKTKLIILVCLAILAQCDAALSQWLQVTEPGAGIACLAEFDGNLYAGSDSVFYSTDDGIHWMGLSPWGISSFAIMGTEMFGIDSGVLRSTNGGKDWKYVDSGFNLSSSSILQILAVSGTNLFAGLLTCPACDPVFISSGQRRSFVETS